MTFLWTGYVLTWVAVGWYAWRLERRIDETEERAGRLADDEPMPPSP